jgi:hypothetical protein
LRAVLQVSRLFLFYRFETNQRSAKNILKTILKTRLKTKETTVGTVKIIDLKSRR